MNTKPLVTIIIPCYNGEKYVDRCLDCIHKQDYTELQVLFVDDCSIDSSVERASRHPGVD